MDLPYLTSAIPPIPLRFKGSPADFVVEEIPRFDPCGSGDHVYVLIEKVGRTTRQAVNALARALSVPAEHIGVAGQKDAESLTRQYLSVLGAEPARIQALALPQITILAVARHRAKLRLGDLKGNRFQLRLRGVDAARLPDLAAVLDVLTRRGVPNYFGPQRFGMRGDTWMIGSALLRGDFEEAVACIAGRPLDTDPEAIRAARSLTATEKFLEAARAWPAGFEHCQVLCRRLADTGGNAKRAVLSLDRRLLGFYVSAWQAWIFNQVVAERLSRLDEVLAGDIVVSQATGAMELVRDPARFGSAAAAFEMSATGPLVGLAMPNADGQPGALEVRILVTHNLALTDLPRTGPLKCIGGRRPVRFKPEELSWDTGTDERGGFVALRFTLPAGCYATSLLREVGKAELREG